MRTYTERKLEQIRNLGMDKGLILSTDIYYDDLAVRRKEQFVVKITAWRGRIEHFRSNHIRKSLKMALKWVEER